MTVTNSIKIEIDQSQAQKKLNELSNELNKTKKVLKDLANQNQQGSAEWKKHEKALQENSERFKKLVKDVKLTEISLKDLKKYRSALQQEMAQVLPGTERFKELESELYKVNKQVVSLTQSVNNSKSSIQHFIKGYRDLVQPMTFTYLAARKLYQQLNRLTDSAVKLSDTFTDVGRSTGLTEAEVRELDKSLRTMDTRTSREDLLRLAETAGALGLSAKEDVEEFVRAVDKIKVALGKNITDDAIKQIGKIAEVFGTTKDLGIEQAYLKIASYLYIPVIFWIFLEKENIFWGYNKKIPSLN